MGVALVNALTVLLPTYNGARYLPRQLDSLRAQTFRDFAVLIQDDGSDDGTAAIPEGLRDDPRFRFGSESGRHLGAKGNFLSLMRQADTPYAALCDQDDVWLPERLEKGMAAIRKAEKELGADTPVLVHSDCIVTDEAGETIHDSFFAHQGWDPGAVTLPRLLVQNNVTGCTSLMNRALYQSAAGHADPERIFMHDWFLAMTAAAFGRIVFIPEGLVRYRQHGRNAVGASRRGIAGRALQAMRSPGTAKDRIALTYEQASAFLNAYGDTLPETARDCVRNYLSTRGMPKVRRLAAVRRGGYTMQSRAARLGQILFG